MEDSEKLLNQFESIDEDVRDEHAPKLYMHMWKIAFKVGKLSLANNYAKKFLAYLIEHKRIPQIKIFIESVNEAGLLKNNSKEYFKLSEILLGKKIKVLSADLKHLELFLDHPEHWKQSSEFLKQYLLIEEEWDLNLWKYCYEFILLYHFDKEIFRMLLEKSRESKNKAFEKKLLSLLDSKKIKVSRYQPAETKDHVSKPEKLNIDYDQIAMELLSGAKEPSFEEQRRVINSLKYISEEELFSKGQEMIVAFELLGMEQVVLSLCERMISGLSDVKQRASTFYVWVQALFNTGDFYKAIDLADEVLLDEPLYGDERLAFQYVKAEACLKVNKIKMAKELYLSIKKQNPHYRLVGERLKSLEAN
ncbi:MAG: hypothetical protein WC635_08485 [Bacteriovorax sp.]|jgi:hypothetical protein